MRRKQSKCEGGRGREGGRGCEGGRVGVREEEWV